MHMLEIGTMGDWLGVKVGDVVPAGERRAAPAPEPGAFGWYIVYTAHAAPARQAIERRGWTVYVPMTWRWRSVKQRGRLRAERKSRRQLVSVRAQEPMFPGYLFVAARSMGPEAHDLMLIHNVADVVRRQRDDFVRVGAAVIAELEARERAAGDETRDAPKPLIWKKDTAVRVSDGPFAGFNAVVLEDSASDDVRIDVFIFGRSTPVVSPVDWIERVA